MIDPSDRDPLPLDRLLDLKITNEGGFLSELTWTDRQRLRKVTKMVHMKNYPTEMISDREADKMIEAMGPATQAYLIQRKWEDVK